MRSLRVPIFMLLVLTGLAPALAQSAASITAFAADRQSITPDEAESGVVYVNLTWVTSQVNAGQSVRLQVLVLGQWYDTLPAGSAPLAASGSLRWTMPHTLDFIPPTFRLIIQDSARTIVDRRELVIPYVNIIDPTRLPRITAFNTTTTAIHARSFSSRDFSVPVNWQVVNRPARANVIFEQVLDNGQVVSVELPRFNVWIRSGGNGAVKPVADGGDVLLRLSLVNIDTREVYAQQTLTIPVMPDTLPVPLSEGSTPTPNPAEAEVVRFTSSAYNLRRGEKITLHWETKNATSVWLDVYDIDFFPRNGAPLPYIKQENLPAAGSLELTIPADYRGGGWQMHLLADNAGIPGYDFGRIDLVLTDAEQPNFMNLNYFTVSQENVRRGDVMTVSWDAYVTTRTSNQGVIQQVTISGYENRVYLSVGSNGQEVILPEAAQTFRDLPLKHSMQVTIPNAHVSTTRAVLMLGLTGVPIQGVPTDVGSGILSLNLLPSPDTVKTETVSAAFQQFAGGMMVWNASTGAVTVYYGLDGGEYSVYSLSSYSSLPDNPVQDAPPDGQFKPVNAFGRVWGNHEGVRHALGWAVTGESGYTMTVTTRLDSSEIVTVTLPNERRVYQFGASWNF